MHRLLFSLFGLLFLASAGGCLITSGTLILLHVNSPIIRHTEGTLSFNPAGSLLLALIAGLLALTGLRYRAVNAMRTPARINAWCAGGILILLTLNLLYRLLILRMSYLAFNVVKSSDGSFTIYINVSTGPILLFALIYAALAIILWANLRWLRRAQRLSSASAPASASIS